MINKKRLVQTFIDLVKIDSPSFKEEAIVAEVSKRLKKLGAKVRLDSYGNVIAKIQGKGKPFILNAHLDTVEPGCGIKPIKKGGRYVTNGKTIVGADPKSGVALIFEALTSITEDKKKLPALEIIFTVQEEQALLGSINLDYSRVLGKRGLTFDGGGSPENIYTEAPGYTKVDAVITGRAAHAGAEPELGISAIKIASEIIQKLPLGRIDHETTANIGLITGGSARNAVPETVELNGEIRSRDLKKLKKLTLLFQKTFDDVIAAHDGASLKLALEQQFIPYKFDNNHPFIKSLHQAYEKIGIKHNCQVSGGATDANIFYTHGIDMVVIGTGMHNAHTTKEYLEVDEMLLGARLCEQILLSL
jgi:tripeptide aminopeptidase